MRTSLKFVALLPVLSGCYHGLDLDPTGFDGDTGPGEASTGEVVSGSDESGDDGSGGDEDDSGGSTGGGPEYGEACGQCGCTVGLAQTASPSVNDDLQVALTEMPDGGTLLAATGGGRVRLSRFYATGELAWERTMTGNVDDIHVIALSTQYYALAGSFRGNLALVPDDPSALLTSKGGVDAFISFHSEKHMGSAIWHRTFGDEADQRITGIVRTGECDVYSLADCRLHVAGIASGMFGLLDSEPADGTSDYFVLGMPAGTANGSVWSLSVPSGAERPPAPALVTVDDDLVFASTLVEGADPGDIEVRRMQRDGIVRWDQRFVADGAQDVAALAADDDGSLRLTGRTRSQFALAGGSLGADGATTPFLVGLDAEGEPTWAHDIAGWPSDTGGLAVVGGLTVVTGSVSEATDFGGGMLEFGGARDVFVSRYESTGAHRCSGLYGGLENQSGLLAVRGGAGRIHVVARVRGSIAFAGGEWLTSESDEDLVIATLDF